YPLPHPQLPISLSLLAPALPPSPLVSLISSLSPHFTSFPPLPPIPSRPPHPLCLHSFFPSCPPRMRSLPPSPLRAAAGSSGSRPLPYPPAAGYVDVDAQYNRSSHAMPAPHPPYPHGEGPAGERGGGGGSGGSSPHHPSYRGGGGGGGGDYRGHYSHSQR
ncbi:unnamed protein product, partial [Closterium sp. NIES-54]